MTISYDKNGNAYSYIYIKIKGTDYSGGDYEKTTIQYTYFDVKEMKEYVYAEQIKNTKMGKENAIKAYYYDVSKTDVEQIQENLKSELALDEISDIVDLIEWDNCKKSYMRGGYIHIVIPEDVSELEYVYNKWGLDSYKIKHDDTSVEKVKIKKRFKRFNFDRSKFIKAY